MSEELRVKLLGSPSAFIGDDPVTGFVSIKSQALLYFLTATEESHRRDVLAALLSSDVPDATARRNLRDVLSNLRRLIGPFLTITRQKVGFNPDAPIYCDSRAFLQTLTAVHDIGSPTAPSSASPLEALATAVDLYKGEFLAGFYVSDASLFEEWMLAQREHLRQTLGNGLAMLVSGFSARREYKTAIRYALLWSALDPSLTRTALSRPDEIIRGGWGPASRLFLATFSYQPRISSLPVNTPSSSGIGGGTNWITASSVRKASDASTSPAFMALIKPSTTADEVEVSPVDVWQELMLNNITRTNNALLGKTIRRDLWFVILAPPIS